jgi:hypothetical protein
VPTRTAMSWSSGGGTRAGAPLDVQLFLSMGMRDCSPPRPAPPGPSGRDRDRAGGAAGEGRETPRGAVGRRRRRVGAGAPIAPGRSLQSVRWMRA